MYTGTHNAVMAPVRDISCGLTRGGRERDEARAPSKEKAVKDYNLRTVLDAVRSVETTPSPPLNSRRKWNVHIRVIHVSAILPFAFDCFSRIAKGESTFTVELIIL